jgi:ribosomal protein L40E
MKLADLAQARLSIQEPIVGFCQVDDCQKPVSAVVTATFPSLSPRRVCICSTCLAKLQPTNEKCHACGGEGWRYKLKSEIHEREDCPACKGTGKVAVGSWFEPIKFTGAKP